MDKRTLLAVLAHPDDESFGIGGTLAKYVAGGVDVHVAIMTDGAAGSVVEAFEAKGADLAEVRRQELEAAVEVLGATLHTMGYRDSGYIDDPANHHPDALINADKSESIGRVVSLIREVRPQVVITHDETGGYFHPDHIMTHQVTKAAFHAAADPEQYPDIGPAPHKPQRLFYSVVPRRWIKVYSLIMRLRGQDPTRVGRNNDVDITKMGRASAQLHAGLNVFPYWEVKQAAGAKHESQGGGSGFGRSVPEWIWKRLFSMEYFALAHPPPENGTWYRDLFTGVKIGEHEQAPTIQDSSQP